VGCCGRSLISVGMLADASRTVCRTARALLDLVERSGAVAVVGCEPSCVSAIKDDWLELELTDGRGAVSPDVATLRRLAPKTFLVEEFVDQVWADKGSHPAIERRVLLHAHCHQKALWGAETSARLLRRLAGANLHVLQSGCCGMAGSFGYTADRYDLSMA